jgi:hypothetical protein
LSPDFLFESMNPYHPICSLPEEKFMRRTLRDLADARKELLEIQQEFGRLEKRIDAVRDCVTDSLTRIFGEDRPAITALAEEELIENPADRVAARFGTLPAAKKQNGNRFVREKEAAAFLGISGRGDGEPNGVAEQA